MFSALLGVLFLLIFLQSLIGCYFLLICPPFCFVAFCCNCCCCFFCMCFRVRLLFPHLNTFACLSHLQLVTDKTVNQDHPMHFFLAACIMIIDSCIERKQIEEQLHYFFLTPEKFTYQPKHRGKIKKHTSIKRVISPVLLLPSIPKIFASFTC